MYHNEAYAFALNTVNRLGVCSEEELLLALQGIDYPPEKLFCVVDELIDSSAIDYQLGCCFVKRLRM